MHKAGIARTEEQARCRARSAGRRAGVEHGEGAFGISVLRVGSGRSALGPAARSYKRRRGLTAET